MTDIHEGACLCGAVRFTTHGPLRGVVYCHCSQCRKQTGHHYAATNVADKNIEIRGTSDISWYRASEKARRGFCRVCGSALFWKHDELDNISVMAGAFEKPTRLKAEAHIFVADKGEYYDIDDGLPQFDRSAPNVKTEN